MYSVQVNTYDCGGISTVESIAVLFNAKKVGMLQYYGIYKWMPDATTMHHYLEHGGMTHIAEELADEHAEEVAIKLNKNRN